MWCANMIYDAILLFVDSIFFVHLIIIFSLENNLAILVNNYNYNYAFLITKIYLLACFYIFVDNLRTFSIVLPLFFF